MPPDESTPQNENALDQQVRAFLASRHLIQSYIRGLVRDSVLAEDVFQEVWVRFEKSTRQGEVIISVPAWCRATARLVALESWRKQGREQATPDAELSALIDQAYSEQDEREEFWHDHRQALLQCLESLPPRSRNLITRRYHEERPISEIAEQLSQSLGCVKTALCRLRLALADCVRRRLPQHSIS